MINANELRIGNWFKHTKNWSYRQDGNNLKEFNFQWNETDWYSVGDCMIFLNDIEPIPLTEEILLKCGFSGNKHWFFKEDIMLGYITTDENIQCEWKLDWDEPKWRLIDVKYLHQLQNLYFALTGKELEINL